MNPDPARWARIEELLDAALDRRPDERAVYLDRACADDAELRAEVERLLRAMDAADAAFDQPPSEVVAAAAVGAHRDRLEHGDLVGPWRILALLGRGGMGAVYLAERADGAFERHVALKVVKRGMDTDEILRRFRQERQILARLEHPNIAGLLDGGATAGGVPYFAMELVRGEPIDTWCDANRLTVEQRLRLFLPVCDAVRHAHGSLIVHRDLKPGNILIIDGAPKLLDFGIAKVLHIEGEEDEPATRLQERRLTPRYAAPEQMMNEPTTTSTDVYSLGIILYELLTGRAPYRLHGGISDMERIVCTAEPRTPSSVVAHETRGRAGAETVQLAGLRATRPDVLRTTLHGDLDAIIMKALEKEPERRYPSVEAFAEDIRRHLSGRPVQARPASQWYRVRKFVGRNRAIVGLSTAAALALVMGTAVALWQAGRAEAESLRAQEEAARATAALDYVLQTFGEFDPDRLGGQRMFSYDEFLDNALQYLRAYEDRPELYASLANTLGQLAFKLGAVERADSLYRTVAAVLQDAGPHVDLAASHMGLGEIAMNRVEVDSAVLHYERALEIHRALDHPRTTENRLALAFALYGADQPDRARAEYEALLAEPLAPPQRAAALEGLGDLTIVAARSAGGDSSRTLYTDAARFYRQVIDLRAGESGRLPPEAARMLWGLGEALLQTGQHTEALATTAQANEQITTTYGADHPQMIFGHYYEAAALEALGRHRDAADAYRASAELGTRHYGPAFHYVPAAWRRCGELLFDLGALAEARGALLHIEQAVAPGEEASGQLLAELAHAHHLLGRIALREGALAEAERRLRQALAIFGGRLEDMERWRAAALDLATVFERTGRQDSAAVYRADRGVTARGGAGSPR